MENLTTPVINHPLVEALLNSTSVAIGYFDEHFKIMGCNTLFYETLKLENKPESLFGLNLFSEEELSFFLDQWQKNEKKEFNVIDKIIHEDGTIHILNVKMIGEFREEVLTGGLIMLDDVTLKESTQMALASIADHQTYDDIFHFLNSTSKSISELFNVPMVVFTTLESENKRHKVRKIWPENDSFHDLEFYLPESDITLQQDKASLHTYTFWSAEQLDRFNQGLNKPFRHQTGVLLQNRDKSNIGTVNVFYDNENHNKQLIHEVLPILAKKISYEVEHSRAFAKLQQSEQLFRSLYDESPLGILMICEEKARIMRANPRICEMLGYSESELQELTAYDITHPEDRHKHKSKFEKTLSGEQKAFDFEKRYLRKDGTSFWVNIAASVVRDDDDKPLYDLASIQDITEKQQARELIKEQVEALNHQNQKLEKYIDSNLQLENFAYIASHDLKAPLRSIGNFAQLLKRKTKDTVSQDEKDYVDFILEGVKDMNQLIESLLLYSKINSTENTTTRLNLPHILNNVKRNLNALISENSARVIIDNIPDQIVANKTKLTQLFQNLIVNGIKFQQKGNTPEVRITCKETSKKWAFQVQDNGIGIEPQYHEQIFTLFKRLHGKSEYEGSGIGLAYCKRVVDKHGGDIWLESEAGKGTSFFFTIRK